MQHRVELGDVVLQLDDEALRAGHENDLNLDEFAVVLELALFQLDERFVGASKENFKINFSNFVDGTHLKVCKSVPKVVAN